MSKEKAFDESTARQMAERVANFRDALNEPDKKVGEKRAQRKANPDFVAPEPIGEARFDQKNREDRWSKTVYGEGDYGDATAKITVQDPADPDDIVLDPITPDAPTRHRIKGDEELREAHGEKVSTLEVDDIDPKGPNA
jgi:hypothetical protein